MHAKFVHSQRLKDEANRFVPNYLKLQVAERISESSSRDQSSLGSPLDDNQQETGTAAPFIDLK
jgi:hypothetical protein